MAYSVGVPGLNKALKVEDLEKSRNIYNQLPDDSQQPEIRESHIHDLTTLFVRNRADRVFGIHLAHAHFTVPDKTVLLRVNHKTLRCRWASATAFQAIDLNNVHRHIIVLTDHGFHPYEYQAGPVPDLSQVDDAFLAELAEFLSRNKLETVVGLQIIDPHPSNILELVLPQGTVMLDVSNVNGCIPTRQTGWKFEARNGELRVCKANKTHARHTNGHDIFNEGAPHPKLETFQDIRHTLEQENILCC